MYGYVWSTVYSDYLRNLSILNFRRVGKSIINFIIQTVIEKPGLGQLIVYLNTFLTVLDNLGNSICNVKIYIYEFLEWISL